MQGEVVILTDLLLRQLDRDEVDAVLAHEMAHLARRDPQHLGTALVAVIAVPTMLAVWFGMTIAVVALALCLLALRVYQRRIEYATDARALTLGVRAETLITGLARLHHLSQVPVRWSPAWGLLMTHPSLEWRAQRLARIAGLDAAQVSGWLEAPPPAGALHRVPSSLNAPRAFGTAFRQGAIARLSWSLLAIAAIVPALILAGLGPFESVPRAVGIVLAALAGVIAWVMCWALATSASMRGLERTIAARLGARFAGASRTFVGLAPDETPRVYEGFAAWDAGFLTLVDGRLDYEGEEATFSLTPRQIHSVEVDEGLPGWVRVTAVRIGWTGEDGTSGTLRLVPLGGTSAFGVGARARRLCARLEEWRAEGLHAAPRGLLGAPPSHEVTSASPRAALTPRAILTTLIVLGVLSLAAAFLIGLPVHPFARGWFDACAASTLAFMLVVLPVLRWREPAHREQSADAERRAA
jgi:Zn-dependent protease with chaperone function